MIYPLRILLSSVDHPLSSGRKPSSTLETGPREDETYSALFGMLHAVAHVVERHAMILPSKMSRRCSRGRPYEPFLHALYPLVGPEIFLMAGTGQRSLIVNSFESDRFAFARFTLLPSVILSFCQASCLVGEASLFVVRPYGFHHSLILRHSFCHWM